MRIKSRDGTLLWHGMNISALLFLCCHFALTTAYGSPLGSDSTYRFTLTIDEKRSEKRIAGPNLNAVPIEFDSRIKLFGRISYYSTDSCMVFRTLNDSIIYRASLPLAVETFMSADTMYYTTGEARNVISKGYIPKYDSMLACVFRGEALKILVDCFPPAQPMHPAPYGGYMSADIVDLKEECNSGEYSRINLPVSLGAFFATFPFSGEGNGYEWEELKRLPSFSGLHFHPAVRMSFKAVDVEPQKITAVISADTVFKDITLTTPSKKRIVILRDKIHIGGTVIIDRSLCMPVKGEIRIEESIQLLRPELSSHVGSKKCSYILRFNID